MPTFFLGTCKGQGESEAGPCPSCPASSAAQGAAVRFQRPCVGVGGQRLPSSVSGHASSSVPSDVLWAPTTGAPRMGRIGGSPDLAHPLAASLMLFVTQQGSQGNFTVWGRGFRDIVTSLERNTSSSSLSDLASAPGLPFFLFPHPEAKWSPGQSTKWLFATKHLQKPEGGSWPVCQSRLPHSHTVTHTALRRLCQQAWPKWAQLLSLSTCRK